MTKAEIQLVRALNDKRGRMEHGLFVAEGEKLIAEIRSSRMKIRKIFALEGVFAGEEVEVVSRKDMERLSLLKTASNSLALVEIPQRRFRLEEHADELMIALDDVQNPGNLGTIMRVADWFGIHHILASPATADCFNPKVVQATMGAILRVEIHYLPLAETLEKAQNQQIPIYGAFLEGENIYRADLSPAGIIVMGNEGRGITEETAAKITHKILIPNYPEDCRTTESLNVAMATGIICSEFRRRMK